MNVDGGSAVARVMNSPEFLGHRLVKITRIDEIKKIFEVMQVTRIDRVELTIYRLKDVAHIWSLSGKRIRVQMRLLSLRIGLVRLFSTSFSQ